MAGCLTKSPRKRTGIIEAEFEANVRDRRRRLGEENLGSFDSTSAMITMRRHPEALPERSAKIVGVEPHQLRQLGQ
jgi:hypothetical protein